MSAAAMAAAPQLELLDAAMAATCSSHWFFARARECTYLQRRSGVRQGSRSRRAGTGVFATAMAEPFGAELIQNVKLPEQELRGSEALLGGSEAQRLDWAAQRLRGLAGRLRGAEARLDGSEAQRPGWTAQRLKGLTHQRLSWTSEKRGIGWTTSLEFQVASLDATCKAVITPWHLATLQGVITGWYLSIREVTRNSSEVVHAIR